MARAARVTSIAVIDTTAVALKRFRTEAAAILDELQIQLQRALEWIHHDRKDFWADELRRGWEGVSAARLQLQQAQVSRRIAGHEPACIDEKRALERAKRRLETAQQKVEAVKHWTRVIERAVDEFQQSRVQFVDWLDTDLVQAVGVLNRMTAALESYTSLEAPAPGPAPPFGQAAVETPPTAPEPAGQNAPPAAAAPKDQTKEPGP
jgi:uncharacterized protein YukE